MKYPSNPPAPFLATWTRGNSALPVGITREGQWRYFPGPLFHLETGDWQDPAACVPCTLSLDRGARQLLLSDGRRLSFDAVFPVLHGKNGEDGTVQGLFELMDVPAIGCGTLASALGMDKVRAHLLASQAGVRVPKSAVFSRGADLAAITQAAETLGYPLFVKPVRAGSSFGVSRQQPRTSSPPPWRRPSAMTGNFFWRRRSPALKWLRRPGQRNAHCGGRR